MSTTALTHREDMGGLVQWREPEEVLEQARKASVALKKVLELKENKVMFNNEQYLEREDWGTVARFFNCTAKSIETRFVEFPSGDYMTRGFEATAVVIDINTGQEVGRAESMCLDEEDNWGEVTVYEWKDKLDKDGKKIWNPQLRKGKGGYEAEKVAAGTKPKPLFQLRSMAQTRAEAKALKSVFGWVVVLAGYKPTPAEELTGKEDFSAGQQQGKPQVQQPTRTSEKTQAQGPQQSEYSGVIKQARQGQNGTLWLELPTCLVVVTADNIDGDMKPGFFIKIRGVEHTNDKVGKYVEAKALIELKPVQEGEVLPPQDQKPKETEPLPPEAVKTAEVLDKLEETGKVTRASNLPTGQARKPGTIGVKKAQRLYTIMSQSKAKNNGFTEEEAKRILATLPTPIDHLRDLEEGLYLQFEKWATGEDDWRKYWEDEPEPSV